MKGTVPYNDPSISTPEVLQDETPVESSQQGTINSSKVYTSAACLGLALASGMLFPKASEATTEPSGTVSTPVIHPSTDSEHSAASTTPNVASEAWQPSLLRDLSEMNRNSGLANQTTAEDNKPLNKDIAEVGSEPSEPTVSSPLLPTRPVEPYSTVPSAPNPNGSATVEISRPSSYSWESDIASPAPRTVYTQPKIDESKFPRTSKFPGTVVIESDLSRTPVSRVYNVTPGDTVAKIAIRHQISVEALIETNRLSNPNHIVVNQRLKIPHQQTISPDSKLDGSSVARDGVSIPGQSLPNTAQTGTLFNRAVLPSVLPSEVKQPLVQKPLTVPLGGSVLSQMAAETGDRGEIALSALALGRFQSKGTVPKPLAAPLATTVVVDERRLTKSAAIASIDYRNLSGSDSKNFRPLETRSSTKVYTERLRSEVNRLRAEYQDQTRYQMVNASWEAVDNEEAEVVAQPTMVQLADRLRRTNPEFAPQADPNPNQQLVAQAEPVAAELIVEQLQNASELDESQSTDEVVATAPLSSSAYDPLKNPAIGRIVSPELPPLLGPDAYLPGGSNQFKGYTWPSQGILTSGYGWRWGRMHRGIDIAGPIGTPIVAAAPGVVSYAGWNSGGYGNLVEIVHPDGSLTLYAHNNRILVNKGQKVVQGQQISEMGSTGRSTGPHLHFEIHSSGTGAVNPMALLPQERSNLSQN
ncbi:MAG: peptidoglycan DD-metalloendopeptidase family protein [Microcoleaceae cyanobacterium]